MMNGHHPVGWYLVDNLTGVIRMKLGDRKPVLQEKPGQKSLSGIYRQIGAVVV